MGCTHQGGQPRPTTQASKPALDLIQTKGASFDLGAVPTGHYVVYATSTAAVHEPVTVIEVQPLEKSGALEPAESMVAFYACQPQCRDRPGIWAARILLGGVCSSRPPASRVLNSAAGMELLPGDAPIFVVVGRVRDASAGRFTGIRVTYEAAGKRYEATSPHNTVTTDYTQRDDHCDNPETAPWLSRKADDRIAVRLS